MFQFLFQEGVHAMSTKLITIFSPRLAKFLINNGCKLTSVRPDLRGNGFNVFMFENTQELQSLMSEYTKNKK